MKSGIYKILNEINNKFYIGSAVNYNLRKANHICLLRKGLHKNQHLQAAWNKYGEEKFKFSLITICAVPDLILYEQRFLDYLKPSYNMNPTAGSPLGRKLSEETKRKIGLSNKGNKAGLGHPVSQETRLKISQAHKGVKKPVEQVEKMRQTKLGKRK